MTTNQTIDGVLVPRETLQWMLDEIGTSRHVTQWAESKRSVLLDLLDSNENTLAPHPDPAGWVAVSGRLAGMYEIPATFTDDKQWMLGMQYLNWRPVYYGAVQEDQTARIEGLLTELIECKSQVGILSREQPAPVAVVLPERAGKQQLINNTHYSEGWNACLDEVTRLNKKE